MVAVTAAPATGGHTLFGGAEPDLLLLPQAAATSTSATTTRNPLRPMGAQNRRPWTRSEDVGTLGHMTAALSHRSNREWFVDRRAPDRRLQVTWHTADHTAVLSIWQGEVCTGTFQLRMEDAAALIAHLADGLGRAAASEGQLASPARGESWPARMRRGLVRARGQVTRLRPGRRSALHDR